MTVGREASGGLPDLVWPAARGVAAGVVATVAMSLPMLLARHAHLLDRQPPEEITERLAARSGLRLRGAELDITSGVAHLAFGAAAGSVFAVARPRLMPSAPWSGPGFGALIWALAYLGVLPRLDLVRGAHQTGPGRDVVMLVAHLVYGAVLALLLPDARDGDRERA